MSAPNATVGALAADDNPTPRSRLEAEIDLPKVLPIQWIEVEVVAELLDSLLFPANDNEAVGEK